MVSIELATLVSAIAMVMSVMAVVLTVLGDRRRKSDNQKRPDTDVTITLDVDGERRVYRHLSPATYRKLTAMLGEAGDDDDTTSHRSVNT